MPHLAIRGINHYYEWMTESGEPRPSGQRPVLVFLHGWGGSARYWESTAQALAPYFDCLLYDLRGFGRSSGAALKLDGAEAASPDRATLSEQLSYELDAYAEDLAALLDQLGIAQIVVNGHSMGASIATVFINRYAERVERAILTCSGIFEYDQKSFAAFHKFGGYVVKFRPRWLYGLPFMNRLFMQRFLHRPIPAGVSRAFLNDFLMADYDAALGTIFTSVSQKAAEVMPQEFAQIQVPTLLIAGEKDIIIPAALGQRAAALNDRITYVEIANTAHFPMLEDASTYLKQVYQFLGLGAEQTVPASS
ncbi:MAG: alpha/beta fold hydrolase [Leptolyngbyaceae cyanobacterium]